MKIYKLSEDVNKYQWIMPVEEKSLFDNLSFDCFSKKNEWVPLDMYIFNPKKKAGNFYSLGGAGALVFDEKVLDAMRSIFEMAGEILPLNLNGNILYCLNVLECINNLDQTKTIYDKYEDGTNGRILKYVFHINRFPESSIFKIPESSKTEVLTYSGLKDSDDEFVGLYLKNEFTGLVFEEIFSD
jgi:hypothetical protein